MGVGLGVPGFGDRIGQMAHGLQRRRRDAQEQPRRQARRRTGIGLRLAAPGQRRIEDMRPEAGFGRMAALPVGIAEQRVQPAIGDLAGLEIIGQLDMTAAAIERGARQFIDVEGHRVRTRQIAEAFLGHQLAGGIIDQCLDRQLGLRGRHRRRQRHRRVAVLWQHRRGKNKALAEPLRQPGNRGIGFEVVALDIGVRDARAPIGRDHLIARAHQMLARLDLDLLRPACIGQEFGHAQPARRKGGDLLVERDNAIAAHQAKTDLAPGNGAGMAVLHPQHDLLASVRRRQAGIEIGRPGIGVMGLRQHAVAIAIGVERVFDDVVSGRAYHMHEELAGKGAAVRSARAPRRCR